MRVAGRINAYAAEAAYDYTTSDTGSEIQAWAQKQSGEKRARASAPARSEPTLSDLLAVKEAAGSLDGETVKRVAELAAQVGGLDNLRRCLEALDKLKGIGHGSHRTAQERTGRPSWAGGPLSVAILVWCGGERRVEAAQLPSEMAHLVNDSHKRSEWDRSTRLASRVK